MIVPPDEIYSAAEAASELAVCERQVHRYLASGKLKGSRASGTWKVAALQIWRFKAIEEEMLASWREYCRAVELDNFREEIEPHNAPEE